MATQVIDQAPAAEADAAEAPAAGNDKKKVVMLGAAGLIVGLMLGLFVVGPIFAKNKSAAPKKPAAEAAAKTSEKYEVANLVLNPAGSGGSRFLMVTATFEVKDAGAKDLLKEKDAEVRDHILGVLGSKTVDDLSDISKREAIKKEVLNGVAPMFPKGTIAKVFFAQFVIQ